MLWRRACVRCGNGCPASECIGCPPGRSFMVATLVPPRRPIRGLTPRNLHSFLGRHVLSATVLRVAWLQCQSPSFQPAYGPVNALTFSVQSGDDRVNSRHVFERRPMNRVCAKHVYVAQASALRVKRTR